MLYLTVAVIFASVLGLLNLLLVIGVIRRLREHTELLSQHSSGARRADLVMLAAGERIGEFEAAIAGGDTFSTAVLPQRLLAGFFTPWCDSCHERLPAFI